MDELMRNNPMSIIKVDLSCDELREGRSVFKKMFVYLYAGKRGCKARCMPIIGLDGCLLKVECLYICIVSVNGTQGMRKLKGRTLISFA